MGGDLALCGFGAAEALGELGLDLAALLRSDAVVEAVEGLDGVLPDVDLLVRAFDLVLGEAAQIGNVLLSGFAVHAHALDKHCVPVDIAMRVAVAAPIAVIDPALARLPSDEHDCSV